MSLVDRSSTLRCEVCGRLLERIFRPIGPWYCPLHREAGNVLDALVKMVRWYGEPEECFDEPEVLKQARKVIAELE